jgi:hypothetical protein
MFLNRRVNVESDIGLNDSYIDTMRVDISASFSRRVDISALFFKKS